MQVPSTLSTFYEFDADGVSAGTAATRLIRDRLSGLITEEVSPGGTPPAVANVDTLFGYNAYQEQTSAQTTLNGSPIFSESLTRDPAGRIATSVETTLGQAHQWQYSYDTAGRLSQVSVDNGSTYLRTFTYDENGNVVLRTTQASFLPAPTTEVGSVDAQDRLLSFGTKSYTYDLNGQTASISDSSSGLTLTLGYDSQGNLTHVQRSDGKTIDYVIDGFGRRVGKKLNGSLSEQYLYDASNRLAAQTDPNGGVTWLFIYPHLNNSPGQMSSTGPNGQFYRVIQDIRGSPMLVVDTVSSQVAEQLIFDESGKVIEDTNPGLQPIGFAGGLYDSDTGFLHFGARDYDPSAGRWLQRDPIGFSSSSPSNGVAANYVPTPSATGQTNLYSYVLNDPINSVDFNGTSGSRISGPYAPIDGGGSSGPVSPQCGLEALSPIITQCLAVASAAVQTCLNSGGNQLIQSGNVVCAGVGVAACEGAGALAGEQCLAQYNLSEDEIKNLITSCLK